MTTLMNVYSTLLAPAAPDFPHVLNSHRDAGNSEFAGHLDGFAGYVQSRGNGQMTQTRYHMIVHIQRTRHQFSLNVEDIHFGAFADWVWRANGISFTPDGAVRDPGGRVLIDAGGAGDPQASVPYPPDASERKLRIEAYLAQSGIRTSPTLPPVIGGPEVEFRTPADIASRSLALFIPCLRAEAINIQDPISSAEIRADFPIGCGALTPAERSYVFASAPAPQQNINFAWRYEALAVLQWAIGLTSELPWPSQICDVPMAARNVFDNNNHAFIHAAALRPADQILDALDLHYRLHWAVRQARQTRQAPPTNLDPSVISERHHALNWLVRFGGADWDDVNTPT